MSKRNAVPDNSLPQNQQHGAASRLVRAKTAAAETGIPYTSLRDLAFRGEILVLKVGRAWYFDRRVCLANIPTAVNHPRGGAHRARTKMVRLPTTLTTIASRRPRGQSSDTVVRRAEIPCRSTNRLSVHTRGSAEPSVRRRAPAAAGSDADPVVKVSLNEMLAR